MLIFSVLVAFFLVVLAWAEEIVGVWFADETMVDMFLGAVPEGTAC